MFELEVILPKMFEVIILYVQCYVQKWYIYALMYKLIRKYQLTTSLNFNNFTSTFEQQKFKTANINFVKKIIM